MKRNLLYKWTFAVIMAIASFTSAFADTQITSLDQLAAGAVVKIYPYGNGGVADLALACKGNGSPLTSYAKAGDGDEWTLEDAGSGFFYLKNELGYYWAYQNNSTSSSLTCTTTLTSAVKVKLTWDSTNNGVCFWNQQDGKGLNNLYSMNYRYNWYSDPSSYNNNEKNTTFEVYKTQSDAASEKLKEVNVEGIIYRLNWTDKTAEGYAADGNLSSNIEIPEYVYANNERYLVTSLSDSCFYRCTELKSITLPNSITSLGESCFSSCSSLASITLPNSITSLGDYCFCGCSSLASITLPNSVTSLGESCFSGCSSLTNITLPSSITSLGYFCFYNCSSLTSIALPNSITSLEDGCFRECSSLTNIILPSSITSLGRNCFYSCSSLTSITLPNSITLLGSACFSGCSSLTSVTLPNGILWLEGNCFSGCSSLTSVTLPNGILRLEGDCFFGCSSLTNITLPSSITSLGWRCFSGCSSLTSITLPNSITSLGMDCFSGCTKLSYIEFPSTLRTIGEDIFKSAMQEKTIVSYAITPPNYKGTDNFIDSNASLIVHKNAIDNYKNASPWNASKSIQAIFTLPNEVSVVKTDSIKLECTVNSNVKDYHLEGLKWTSSNATIASVNETSGVVTGNKVGDVVITATTTDGTNDSASATVHVTPLKVADVELTTKSAVKTIPTKLEAKVLPVEADNKELTWKSLTPTIASITEDGTITGQKTGTAQVQSTTTDGSNISKTFNVEITQLHVSGISLPEEVSIIKTNTKKLEYTVSPAESDNQQLKWTSSNTAVASVDETTGAITANKVGDAVITATATDGSGVSASTTVHVTPLKVTDVELTTKSAVKTVPTKLEVKVLPVEADNKELAWKSLTPTIASITEDGTITGLKTETAQVQCTTTDGSNISKTFNVEITQLHVSGISLPEEVSIIKTNTKKLEYTVSPAASDNQQLKWTSGNTAVASVDETTGAITAIKVGDAVITATATDGSGVSASTTVHVTPLPVSSISLPKEVSIVKTDAQKVDYTVSPAAADNQKLKWTSGNATVASVDETTGIITANKVGDAVITATATDGSNVSASTTVHVTPLSASSLSITKELTLLYSHSQQLEVSILPEQTDNKSLEWSSNNEGVATVDKNGVVTGVNAGTAYITAKTTDGSNLSANCKVTVNPVVINLSTNTINLQKGEKYVEQTATVLPDSYEHKDVVWTASGNGVASVDAKGKITAIKPGVDTLRCSLSYDSSIYSECRVIVYDENVVYVGGLYYILHNENTSDRWATVTSIYGGKNTSLDAANVAQYYSGTISIPETIIYDGNKYTVKKVGSYAFNCQNELQSLYVPRTVTEIEPNAAIKAEKLNRVNVADESQLVNIGEEAFKWCTGLKRFTFDGTSLSMSSIDKAAFRECTALERFVWTGNTSVKTISHSAFYGCTALEQVLWKAKSELQTIQDYAFFKCSVLNNFAMPNTTLSVGNSAFRYNAGLTDIQLSTSLNYIDEYAFGECGFSGITLPESLANIQAGAFINNEHLLAITLPERLQGLGSAAFENNSALQSVTFHTTIETMTIGNNAFNKCPVLNKVYITNMNSFAQTNFNNAKANPANTSQHIYDANGVEITKVVLPKGTKYVNNNAFNGCAYIESIEMPSTMDHVNDNIIANCSALRDVYCYATKVPDFIGVEDPSTMSDVFNQATLHVIYGNEAAYKADSWWGRFYKVEGCDAPQVEYVKVTSITISQENITLKPDDTVQLKATVYPTNATNKNVRWSSSNDDIAMVTDEGFVLAVAEGEADITVEALDGSGIKAVCHVKVESEKTPDIPIVEIKFEEPTATIAVGETKQLVVTYNPENASNKTLTWTSAKPSVATVDTEGNVTGVSEGKTIITAKTTDGTNLSINCVLTVTKTTSIGGITLGDVKIVIKNRHLTIVGLADDDVITVVNTIGFTVYRGTNHEVDLDTEGLYIVKVKGKTLKVSVK